MTIAKGTVVRAVLQGMATANTKFEEWSQGSWVSDYGVEGLMVAYIAAALRRQQDQRESLLLEASFEEIQECSGAARRPGRPRAVMQGKRRADIALFDRRGRTVHVIEAKRKWERSRCFRDIERLLALLDACAKQKNGSLKHGFLALPIVEWADRPDEVRSKIQARARNIEADVRSNFGIEGPAAEFSLGHMRRYPEKYGETGQWAWASFCATFSR